MIRWVAVIFIGLTVFYALLPWILEKLGVGRIIGDLRFTLGGKTFVGLSARRFCGRWSRF